MNFLPKHDNDLPSALDAFLRAIISWSSRRMPMGERLVTKLSNHYGNDHLRNN